jgi:hypothetical protein
MKKEKLAEYLKNGLEIEKEL